VNTPPLLILVALLFWGWQAGYLWLGAAAGVLLETSRVVRWRWALSQEDFNRLWNICAVLFVGLAVLLLVNEGTTSFSDFFAEPGKRPEAMRQAGRSALAWFQWFPMVFLPFMAAVAFNESPGVGVATFSWWLRREEKRRPELARQRDTVTVAYPYVAVCLLAASATTTRHPWFYFALTPIVGLALWRLRSVRFSPLAWCALFALIAMAGHFGHGGLVTLQKRLEEMNVAWFSRFAAIGFDQREARTQIGSLGHIKMSDQILLRIRTDGGNPPPLLRENSYNIYRGTLWSMMQREYADVPNEADQTTWRLLPDKVSRREVSIGGYFRRGRGLVPLPSGASEVANFGFGLLATNALGAALIKDGPPFAIYSARFDEGATFDSAPQPEDLIVPDNEPVFDVVVGELGLSSELPTAEALRRVASYFADNFAYATYIGRDHAARTNQTALARFLQHTRSGHCEYFATATALLLRKAGVPTRYAVGYSVQEGSGSKFVVRARHAHAWTLVWNGTHWEDFDTTPSSWTAADARGGSWLQPLKDFMSTLKYEFSKLRYGKAEWRKWFMLTPLPLLAVVLWKFFTGKQWRKMRAQRAQRARASDRQGTDSEFYRIEQHLAARGLARWPGENWSAWLRRIEQHEAAVASLQRVLLLHQRHRFDPVGLKEDERLELQREVEQWLAVARS
jgi:protein-glutamine gamma-glutamyltransferase